MSHRELNFVYTHIHTVNEDSHDITNFTLLNICDRFSVNFTSLWVNNWNSEVIFSPLVFFFDLTNRVWRFSRPRSLNHRVCTIYIEDIDSLGAFSIRPHIIVKHYLHFLSLRNLLFCFAANNNINLIQTEQKRPLQIIVDMS
jgi:hypothetical protein